MSAAPGMAYHSPSGCDGVFHANEIEDTKQANKTHDRKIEKHGPNLIPRYRANRINNGQVRLLLFDDNNWNANLWTRQLAPVFCFAK